MVDLLAAIGMGFVLGMRHATDPDHVIAVSTIVTRQRSVRHAGLVGALWGVGHTVTIVCVGIAILLFRLTIPPRLGLAMELLVGLMLILLGILNLTGVLQRLTYRWLPSHHHGNPAAATVHSHVHQHNGLVHDHIHEHAPEVHMHLDRPAAPPRTLLQRLGLYQLLRPLLVGLVHGLAGSAAIALLVLAEISNPRWAAAYLGVFGLGTIAGMFLITLAISTPLAYGSRRFATMERGMGIAAGVLSLAFGLFVTVQIAFVDGLFAAHPRWTPH